MQLGETIATYDVDLALRGESGKFEVTSPAGEIYYMTCKPNQTILTSEPTASPGYPRAFLIRKIAEPISGQEVVLGAECKQDALESRTPFLLKIADEMPGPSTNTVEPPVQGAEDPSEPLAVDLFYSNGTEATQACAYVFLGNGAASMEAGRLLTRRCATFNDLDAEIRRLHAQLEQICLRAKKHFYKAYAAGATA